MSKKRIILLVIIALLIGVGGFTYYYAQVKATNQQNERVSTLTKSLKNQVLNEEEITFLTDRKLIDDNQLKINEEAKAFITKEDNSLKDTEDIYGNFIFMSNEINTPLKEKVDTVKNKQLKTLSQTKPKTKKQTNYKNKLINDVNQVQSDGTLKGTIKSYKSLKETKIRLDKLVAYAK
ncbi:MAG: hypothetical protein RR543_01970 [Erysipelotrichales bacterium]